jgi:DNA invertase Pin-like site-specific DNA recombinase
MEVRDERTVDRIRPGLHRRTGLDAQRDALAGLGVAPERVYLDHGLTGTNRDRPGLREALAACRDGDTLVVTKLDRLARSLPDARAIADELTVRHVKLSLGG